MPYGLIEVLLIVGTSPLQCESQLSCAEGTQPGLSKWQRDQLGSGSCVPCRCRDAPELMCSASWYLMAQTEFERHSWWYLWTLLPCPRQLKVHPRG